MRKPKKVQAPEQCQSYLTAGKVYDVISCEPFAFEQHGHGFNILNDHGRMVHCLECECHHLNGGNWIIVETE